MSKEKVRSGAAYLYIETISGMVSSYIFWLVMSKITTAEVIGTSSAMISFATIVVALATMGVPTGVQRILGKSFMEKETESTSHYIKTSFFMVVLSCVICSVAILISRDWIYNAFKIDSSLIIISILLVTSSVIRFLFRYVIIASLSTRILVLSSILPTILRFAVGIILVLLGTGVLGLTIGYIMFPLIGTITLIPSIFKYLRPLARHKKDFSIFKSMKIIFVASVASWIPNVLVALGSQLGTIVVFGTHGANDAGVYFIALSIFTAISTGLSVIFSITYPVLSAMKDGRKRFTWRTLNLSLLISIPISACIIFYSDETMSFFGSQYIQGAPSLVILMLSILPTAVMSGISTLCYSYGNFRQVLVIGLASSIPRTLMYFVLVPVYQDTGAALSNAIGALVGLVLAIIVARQIGMSILWKDIAVIFAIPTIAGFLVSMSGINYLLGTIIILLVTYVLYVKAKVLQRLDVEDVIGILPIKVSNPLIGIINSLSRRIDKSY